MSWTIQCLPDPVSGIAASHGGSSVRSAVALGAIPVSELLQDASHQAAFQEGGRQARVALADFAIRRIAQGSSTGSAPEGFQVTVEPLDRHLSYWTNSNRSKATPSLNNTYEPYMLERSDVWCTDTELHVTVRVIVTAGNIVDDEKKSENGGSIVRDAALAFLTRCLDPQLDDFPTKILQHVACAVVQNRLRAHLASVKAVAFVADGSILPRKSGASTLPMSSPPAIPFEAPQGSPTRQEITVEMGLLRSYLTASNVTSGKQSPTSVCFTGLVVPAGITLIVGGGYHGKSTLLRTIAAGVYDKIPGDGREFCVTVPDAVTVRAEDGRYVNNCNVSAFISNLPTLPGCNQTVDTKKFSTREASGSTSQASNTSEAIEMGATALLVDEDVSAANFMARDGRMRALVMDESITPLLYRVNGLYKTHGISSVVVVGGVGDWLDVPNTVILLNRYIASDATKKAASVSYQFSYGHVQYAGRGVVHRLDWDKEGTPIPRRLTDNFVKSSNGNYGVSLMEGGHVISIQRDIEEGVAIIDDDDAGCIDMSRCEQLLGKKNQLYACGLCVAWILRAAKTNPALGINGLVAKLEASLDEAGGLIPLIAGSAETNGSAADCLASSTAWTNLVESVGFAYRPRRHEIFMALTRMRGVTLEELPVIDDGSDRAAELEAERRKRELAEIWNARRKSRNT